MKAESPPPQGSRMETDDLGSPGGIAGGMRDESEESRCREHLATLGSPLASLGHGMGHSLSLGYYMRYEI